MSTTDGKTKRSAMGCAVGAAILFAVSAVPLSSAAADTMKPADRNTATIRYGTPTGLPEKDTVALERPPVRKPDNGQVAAVRVGQGLRPDGTEIVPNETPRPWAVRE